MTDRQPLLLVTPGMRVRFKTESGVRIGTVKRVDETVFPGCVVVEDADGKDVEIPIHIGLPDAPTR